MSEQNIKWSKGDWFVFNHPNYKIGEIIDVIFDSEYNQYKYKYKSSLECSSFTRFKLDITPDCGIFWANSPMDISSTKLNEKEAQDMINYLKAKNL